MHAHFRSLAVHQALFHKKLLESWRNPTATQAELLIDGLVHDGLWLTKFPLLFTPTYGVERLDAWNKARQIAALDPAETTALRTLVDADLVRFVLKLTEADLEMPVEIFWGGRAMNKPLWQYLAGWFEHTAALRGRLSPSPTLFETVFS
jgi:hypothetical protein